jgi:inorganic pyrophosphatase
MDMDKLEIDKFADVFIEISRNSHIKYEYDKEKKMLKCDRVLHTPFKYLFNYGFIQDTLSPDGDPLDVVVLMDDELIPGCYISCKFLGCLETIDDQGIDPKIIMCPSNKVDPTYSCINDISDIPELTIEKIKYFFSHYKDLENKKVSIGNVLNKHAAIQIYEQSLKDYATFYN